MDKKMELTEVKQILIKARALIEKPENWHRLNFAADVNGYDVDEHDEKAFCFCSWGAISKANGKFIEKGHKLYDTLCEAMEGGIAEFNDNHTHEEVLAKFDEAINSIVV